MQGYCIQKLNNKNDRICLKMIARKLHIEACSML